MAEAKRKERIDGRLGVRVLPNTPINKILDLLVQTRASLNQLIVIPVYDDGAIDFFTTSDRAFEIIGLLEALKQEVLDNIHCAKCGGVVDNDEICE